MAESIVGALILAILFAGVLVMMARAAAQMAEKISWHEDESDI
jgi:hypothetical protein